MNIIACWLDKSALCHPPFRWFIHLFFVQHSFQDCASTIIHPRSQKLHRSKFVCQTDEIVIHWLFSHPSSAAARLCDWLSSNSGLGGSEMTPRMTFWDVLAIVLVSKNKPKSRESGFDQLCPEIKYESFTAGKTQWKTVGLVNCEDW
jgi:hypothetical protein